VTQSAFSMDPDNYKEPEISGVQNWALLTGCEMPSSVLSNGTGGRSCPHGMIGQRDMGLGLPPRIFLDIHNIEQRKIDDVEAMPAAQVVVPLMHLCLVSASALQFILDTLSGLTTQADRLTACSAWNEVTQPPR